MEFHWYWPFARPEELDWAIRTARPDDSILVEVIDRPEAPREGRHGPVNVVRDLPDIRRDVDSRVGWAVSRGATYVSRARIRAAHWRSHRFDLVHLHYVNRFTDALVPLPHPLVMSVHDVAPHIPRLGGRAEARLSSRLYRRADALVVHHPALADLLVDRADADPGRIHVVPHQVYPVGAGSPELDPSPPTVLFFGALRQNKGLGLLDGMMARLSKEDIRLVIAGRGDAAVERIAVDLAARDPRVTSEIGHASLERKRKLFAAASLVVLPYTTFASQSGVLHDAYGHGRPVVVTDVGALGRSVRDDGTGVVVPPGDPDALANAVRESLIPSTWAAHAAAARAIAAERSPAETGRRLREIYDVVLS